MTIDGSTFTMDKTWQEIANSDFPVSVVDAEGNVSWNPIMSAYADPYGDGYYVDVLRFGLNTSTEKYEAQFMTFLCNSADGYPAMNMGG